MSGGTSYTAAQADTTNDEARQKVAETQALKNKLIVIDAAIFNKLPVGMTQDEFIYELLNAPEDQIDDKRNIKISQALKNQILALETPLDEDGEVCYEEATTRIARGFNLLAEAKISDQRASKEAVADVLERFIDLDNSAADLLTNMQEEVVTAQNATDGRDEIAKFTAKISVIENYIDQFQELYDRSPIDFGAILGQKRADVHAEVLAHYAAHGDGTRRGMPKDVRIAEPTSRLHTKTVESIASKRTILQALVAHVTSIVEQMQILARYQALTDEQLIVVWGRLGATAKRFASLTSSSTPRRIFKAAGLFRLACLRDGAFQQRLFDALPADVKLPGPGIHSDKDAETLIPNPMGGAWTSI
jgi:hypothetical protein